MLDLVPRFGNAPGILCLGAHCDDIEIGVGGTLLELAERYPGASLDCVVFASNPPREAETRAALAELSSGFTAVTIDVQRFRNGFFPYVGAAIKDYFESLKARLSPDVVFTHAREDRHQDHREISNLTWNTFRDHLILEYEIAKYDGDMGQANAYVEVSAAHARRKLDCLVEHFATQRSRPWFRRENFEALMRCRSIECNARSGYAEAFHARKLRLG